MDRPLRIAMFLGTFPVTSETFILRQITGLLDLGHQVDIFADAPAPPGVPQQPEVETHKLLEHTHFMGLPPECVPWELPIRPLKGQSWIPGEVRPLSNLLRAARALPVFLRCFTSQPRLAIEALRRQEYGFQAESLSILYRLHRLLDRPGAYDVLHAHFGPNGNSFRFAPKLWRAPLLVSFHGYDFCTLPRKQGAGMYRKLFETAELITGNSEFTRTQLEKLGCPATKFRKLPVGLNPEEFCWRERVLKPGESVRILTIGRLVKIKGHEYAIQAVAALREKHPSIHYDIVGDGPLHSDLEKLVHQLGLKHHVTLHGALAGNALKHLMDNAHLFVLSSVSVEGDKEGQGLALQEAQAVGLPVIATQNGGLPEGMLPDQSGFLVPEHDVKALCERLSYLVKHPEIWPILGRNGREFVAARYDIRELNRQLVELYAAAQKSFRTK